MLQDDAEWHSVLNDAEATAPASSIRELFVYILKYNSPHKPAELFDTFCQAMGDDFVYLLLNKLFRTTPVPDIGERLDGASN